MSTEALLRIEPATSRDVPLILQFINELAEYERLAHAAVATEERLHTYLFGPNPAAYTVIAYWGDEPAGFALYFFNFSTFLAKPGLYLEDLFVRPALRQRGIGRALLAHLARVAMDRGCGRMEWSVLDWNEAAIRVYRSIGAHMLDDWRIMRITEPAISALAAIAPAAPRSSAT